MAKKKSFLADMASITEGEKQEKKKEINTTRVIKKGKDIEEEVIEEQKKKIEEKTKRLELKEKRKIRQNKRNLITLEEVGIPEGLFEDGETRINILFSLNNAVGINAKKKGMRQNALLNLIIYQYLHNQGEI